MGAQAGSDRVARNLRVFHARADGAGIRADVDALRFFVAQSFKSMNATDKLPIVGLMLGDVTGIGAPAVGDLVGGQVQLIFATAASAIPHPKSGRIKGIAVTTAKRSSLLPELPTISEGGSPVSMPTIGTARSPQPRPNARSSTS